MKLNAWNVWNCIDPGVRLVEVRLVGEATARSPRRRLRTASVAVTLAAPYGDSGGNRRVLGVVCSWRYAAASGWSCAGYSPAPRGVGRGRVYPRPRRPARQSRQPGRGGTDLAKRDRRADREGDPRPGGERRDGRAADAARGGALRVAVAVGPPADEGLENLLARDVELCKAALLYGDEVTLYSTSAILLTSVEQRGALIAADLVTLLEQVAPVVFGDQATRVVRLLAEVRRQHGSAADREVASSAPELVGMLLELVRPVFEELAEQAGAAELKAALDSGLLRLDPLGTDQPADTGAAALLTDPGAATGAVIAAFIERVGSLLASGDAYPLFDDALGGFVRAGIENGLFKPLPAGGARARQAGTAAGLLERLPSFPRARMDEVLGIRDELREPLVRFRAAMVQITGAMHAQATDDAFGDEVEQVWRGTVDPALQEIRDRIDDHGHLRELTKIARTTDLRAGLKALPVASGGLVLAASRASNLREVLTVVATATAAAATAAAPVLIRAALERNEGLRQVSRDRFYFLYRADSALGGR